VTDLTGTGVLVRLIVHRDRLRLLAWIGGILALVIVTAASTKGLYPTQDSLDQIATAARDNPVALAFNGPDQGLDTIGGQVAFQVGAFGLLAVGFMTLTLLGRLTRAEEDSGRLELVRSMPVGRYAPLAAGLAVVVGTDNILGVLTALSLLAEGLPTVGSLVFGAAFTAFGVTFAGLTAVTAQVAENPRVTTGLAGVGLAASFALRAAGDMSGGMLSWLSPMGWAQKARPYAGERLSPLLLCGLLGAGLTVLAVRLANRRDFAAGMTSPRPGPARAAAALGSPLGLAVRLHRGVAVWWTSGGLALGLVYGSLTQSIDELIGDNPSMRDVIAAYGRAGLTDSYLATSLLITALIAAGPALQIAARLHAEEAEQRLEPLLATPMSRGSWVGSNLATALGAGTLTLLAGAFGLGLAYALTGGGAQQVPRLLAAGLAYGPAVWLLTAAAVALFGLLPRWTAVGWVALAACFAIAMLGPALDLPRWVAGLSPFDHVPPVPAAGIDLLPVAVLAISAVALTAVGLGGFRRRDVMPS
jgi:ABC-2 type transport system permease protein